MPQDGKIHVFMKKESLMQTKRMKELTLLDMGIAMCHMALAAKELWLDWRLVKRRYVKGSRNGRAANMWQHFTMR